jgi:hypothetical protein
MPNAVGVVECDQFIEAYSRCIQQKLPPANREGAKEGLEALRDAWREAAKSNDARKQLPGTCTRMRADTAAQVAKFHCDW